MSAPQAALAFYPVCGWRSGIIANYADMDATKGEVTALLARLSAGDRSAESVLLPRVYMELHRLARAHLRSERPGHTLQATALVHEVYLKICEPNQMKWEHRVHFFRIAARLMRRILIDYARQRNTIKRGSGQVPIPLEEALLVSNEQLTVVSEVDEVLDELAAKKPRLAQVVEMRFFAGLSMEEIAAALGVHERTVKRDWLKARAWLHDRLDRK